MPDRIRGFEEARAHRYDHDRFEPPLRIAAIVRSEWGKGDYFHQVNRSTFSMSLIIDGDGSFRQSPGKGLVEKGDVFMAHRGREQSLATGPKGFLKKYSILAEGPLLDTFLNETGLAETDYVRPSNRRAVEALFIKAWNILDSRQGTDGARLSETLYAILLELAADITEEYPSAIRSAIDYMKRNLGQQIHLEDVCRHVNLSPRHCLRLFERHMGVSPMHFFNRQRMLWGADLLAQTSIPVKQVSAMLGFDDPLYFSARFKQHQGMSPRAYRKSRTEAKIA